MLSNVRHTSTRSWQRVDDCCRCSKWQQHLFQFSTDICSQLTSGEWETRHEVLTNSAYKHNLNTDSVHNSWFLGNIFTRLVFIDRKQFYILNSTAIRDSHWNIKNVMYKQKCLFNVFSPCMYLVFLTAKLLMRNMDWGITNDCI